MSKVLNENNIFLGLDSVSKEEAITLAGRKLVENGYKVAIGEQMEDPSTAKGIVRREVIRVITPGTVLDGNLLENKKNNYLLSLYKDGTNIGLTYVDISTGKPNSNKRKHARSTPTK